jgi:hypothetical protein
MTPRLYGLSQSTSFRFHPSRIANFRDSTFLAAPTPPVALVSVIILAILEEAPETFYELDVVEDVVKKVMASIAIDSSSVARPAREAREFMRTLERYKGDREVQTLLR